MTIKHLPKAGPFKNMSVRQYLMKSLINSDRMLPSGKFFYPNDNFWSTLEEFKHLHFIECGAGNGETTEAALNRGFRMIAIDPIRRPDTRPCVSQVDATTINEGWSPSCWPVICRPNHNGWAGDVIHNALDKGASSIYVSKPDNLVRDLRLHQILAVTRTVLDVGEDGESLYVISPKKGNHHEQSATS